MNSKAQRNGFLILAGLLLLLLSVLEISGSNFWQSIILNLGIYIILAVSLNLSNGFTGVFSLGHIGFMALGAYISAILTLPLDKKASYLKDLPAWLALVQLPGKPLTHISVTAGHALCPIPFGSGLES